MTLERLFVALQSYMHDIAPRYLGPLIGVAHVPGRRALLCVGTGRLVAPTVKLSAAPRIWNSLSNDVSAERVTGHPSAS